APAGPGSPRRHHVRSMLCLPLLKQTRLAGILYLENTLTSDAFTPARMALLEVLASDAAISLENARLYRDLQEREARVRRSEADLHEAQRLSRTGSWKLDLSSGTIHVSPEVLRIFAVQSDEETSSPDFWFDRINHEDRDRAREY